MMLMKKLMLILFFSGMLSVPFVESAITNSVAEQSIEIGCGDFKSDKERFVDDYEYNYRQMEIRKEIERQERLRLEELERQRLAEEERQRQIEANRVVTYNPYNLLEPSNITREEAYQMLEGTALQTLSNAYVYMEELYGVNAIFLMSLSAEESGWGRSSLAISNNNIG